MGARKAPIIYSSFNFSSSNPKTKCNLQITHDRQLGLHEFYEAKKHRVSRDFLFFSFLQLCLQYASSLIDYQHLITRNYEELWMTGNHWSKTKIETAQK